MAKIKSVKINALNLPLRNTFRTALGEKKITRNLLVVLDCGDGLKGYGEASSSLALPEATQEAMQKILREASRLVLGSRVSDWEGICEDLSKRYPKHPTAVSALECALLDAFCRSKNISLSHFFGGGKSGIETDYTIPALAPKKSERIAGEMFRKGFSKFKVKITGKNLDEDLKRITAVFKASGGRSVLVDANQGLTEKSATRLISRMCSKSIEVDLIEQPFQKNDLKSHKNLRKHSHYMIAVDESLRTLADAKKILDMEAADVFNIKIARMGLLQAIRTVQLLWSAGKKLMIGCMMESAAGLSASVHWAAGSRRFSFVDLDSFLLLHSKGSDPLPSAGFTNSGPILSVKPGEPGTGVHDQ